jgi:hypothetical protein
MKFMSDFKELNGKIFNSINECKDAESKILKEREAFAEKEKDKSKLKKKLSGEVDKAEEALMKAYANYEAAKERAREIIEESNKQMLDIINPAKKAVEDAELARTQAIKNFNKECGPYQKIYTGESAQAELDRFNKQFNNLFVDFFKRWF